jgi:hypothetical protein
MKLQRFFLVLVPISHLTKVNDTGTLEDPATDTLFQYGKREIFRQVESAMNEMLVAGYDTSWNICRGK